MRGQFEVTQVELSPEATPTSTDRREVVRLVLAPRLLAVLFPLELPVFNGILLALPVSWNVIV